MLLLLLRLCNRSDVMQPSLKPVHGMIRDLKVVEYLACFSAQSVTDLSGNVVRSLRLFTKENLGVEVQELLEEQPSTTTLMR
jgi:hypothetical protein